MFIPIRCFTCNKILGDKYFKLKEMIEKGSGRKEIFEKLELKNYCCKNIIINHVNIIEIIKNSK